MLTHWRERNAFGQRLLALTVLLFIIFPAVSVSDDLWALHNPAETDILLRRHDGAMHFAMHHRDLAPHALAPFLASSIRFPVYAVLGRTAVPHLESWLDEVPAGFRHTIRPPPVL